MALRIPLRSIVPAAAALALPLLSNAAYAQWTVTRLSDASAGPPWLSTWHFAYGVSGTQQVGFAYWGLTVPTATLWTGTPESRVSLHPADSFTSKALGTSGTQQVGWAGFGGGMVWEAEHRAALWSGTPESWVDLHPAGATRSEAFGASGTQQVGYAIVDDIERASLWSGTAESWVDLHPAGPGWSRATGTSGTQQVGNAHGRASLWSGTAESWVDLHPAGATSSEATGISGTQQVGMTIVDDVRRASLWSGTAESWEDLSLSLPGSWWGSWATGIWSDELFTYVSGYGWNNDTSGYEALLWVRAVPAPGSGVLLGLGGLLAARRRR